MNVNVVHTRRPRFEMRFPSLVDGGTSLVFPCDAQGHVDMDALGERRMCDYLFARATIGHDYGWPRVVPV
jgi:hypothetical protein